MQDIRGKRFTSSWLTEVQTEVTVCDCMLAEIIIDDVTVSTRVSVDL